MGRYTERFLREMARGLAGRESTLEMIPTYIGASSDVRPGRAVIAIDAGGTNLRVAVVSFDAAGRPSIDDLTRHRMPGSDSEIARDQFFDAFAGFVAPVATRADTIGLCFSYAVEMTPQKDGRLIYFSKEIRAKEVEGEMIGAGLAEAMSRRGVSRPPRIILLNDTVATLLAGRNSAPGASLDGYVGLVCGTGLNSAYVEANAGIIKRPELEPEGSQIINMESGSFGRGPIGLIDNEFDATTANPGKYRNEKMVSGAYIGGLSHCMIRCAARDGIFTAEGAKEIGRLEVFTSKDVSDFLGSPWGVDSLLGKVCARIPRKDGEALFRLIDAVVERSAKLVAINLCAVLLKMGNGKDPRLPVCITADGTTFWQLPGFRARVECFMRTFLGREKERFFEITRAEDAPLIGAAIAALTN
jgi:hexokinase